MTKLTMKDLAIKLDSLGYYLDGADFVQVSNNDGIIDTADLSLNSYIKTLDRQRIKKQRRKHGGLPQVSIT